MHWQEPPVLVTGRLFDSPLIQKPLRLHWTLFHCLEGPKQPHHQDQSHPDDALLSPGSFALLVSSTSVPAYICSYIGEGKRSTPAKGGVGEGDLRCLL